MVFEEVCKCRLDNLRCISRFLSEICAGSLNDYADNTDSQVLWNGDEHELVMHHVDAVLSMKFSSTLYCRLR
jgi:hypothetical protein